MLNLLCQRPARCYTRLLLSASACSTASVAIDRYLLQTPALSIKHAADRRDRQTNGRKPNRYINAKQRQQMSQEPFVLHLFYFILDVRACLKPGLRVGCPYVATVTHRLGCSFHLHPSSSISWHRHPTSVAGFQPTTPLLSLFDLSCDGQELTNKLSNSLAH